MKSATRMSLTVRQTAVRLGYTQKYIRDLLYEHRLPGAYKIGRQWRIPDKVVAEQAKAREDRNG